MQVMWWLQALAQRNSGLFWFGILCLGGGLLCMYLAGTSTVQVNGISAWIKPMKFKHLDFLLDHGLVTA